MTKEYKAITVDSCTSGLCNRLRALSSFGAMSEVLGIPLFMYWESDWACSCKYSNILREDFCKHLASRKLLYEQRGKMTPTLHFGANKGRYGATRPARLYHFLVEDKIGGVEWNRLAGKYKRRILPKPRLQKQIADFVDTWPNPGGSADLIGLHIRRTDMNSHIDRKSKGLAPPDKALFACMNAQLNGNGSTKFVLCCDNQRSRRIIVKRYGEHVLVRDMKFSGKGRRQTSIDDAVIDLYCLAATNKIFGTYGSSFSGYAATLGQIPVEFI